MSASIKTKKTRKTIRNASPKPTDLNTQASSALATLKELASQLPIDDALPPQAARSAKALNRVPLEVLSIAASVLAEAPSQYPQFDATEAQAAVTFEQAMGPVAQAAQNLSDSLQKTVLKRRSAMATQALALYASLKANARLPQNEQSRTQVKAIGKLLTTSHKSRATSVTQRETAQYAKATKLQKKQQVAQAAADQASSKANYAAALAALETAATASTAAPPTATQATPAPASSSPAASPTPAVPSASSAPVTSVTPGH
jgi:hypothetical protein